MTPAFLLPFTLHPFTPSSLHPVTLHFLTPSPLHPLTPSPLHRSPLHPSTSFTPFTPFTPSPLHPFTPSPFTSALPFLKFVVHVGVHPGIQKHSLCEWSQTLSNTVCGSAAAQTGFLLTRCPPSPKFQCWKMDPRGARPRLLKNTHSRQRVGRTNRVNIEIWGEGCVPLAQRCFRNRKPYFAPSPHCADRLDYMSVFEYRGGITIPIVMKCLIYLHVCGLDPAAGDSDTTEKALD